MRNAERGSSQIPLVICIVLLLGVGVWAYSVYGEAEDATNRLNTILKAAQDPQSPNPPSDQTVISHINFARGIGSQTKQRLEEVAEITGGREEQNMDLVIDPAKLKTSRDGLLSKLDKGDYTIEFPTDRFLEDPAGGIKIQEGAGKVVVQYGGTRDLRGARPDITAVLDYVVTGAMNRMVADVKRYRDAYVAAIAAKETAEAAYRRDLEAKDGEIRAKVEELAALEARKAQEITDLRRQLTEADAAKAASEEEKNKAVAALTTERNQWRTEAEKASAQVQVLKQRKRAIETDTSPDGSVLSVGKDQDFAVIDLGKSTNNLQAGTNFDVYAIGKGGVEIPKGTLKVVKVEGDSSNCRVLEVFDAFNPVVPGDKIRSLTYSPKETIHIALVGRFQKMGKSDAARRLQSLGVVVDDRVTVDTTFLVVGAPENEAQPIEETAEYKAADLYGIPKISEKELGRFTQY